MMNCWIRQLCHKTVRVKKRQNSEKFPVKFCFVSPQKGHCSLNIKCNEQMKLNLPFISLKENVFVTEVRSEIEIIEI